MAACTEVRPANPTIPPTLSILNHSSLSSPSRPHSLKAYIAGDARPPPATSAAALAAQNSFAWRYMLPFFLLVGAFLLFVWRITTPPAADPPRANCADTDSMYTILRGDTCWAIADSFNVNVQQLKGANEGLD